VSGGEEEEEKSYERIMYRSPFPLAKLKKKNERMHQSPFPLLKENQFYKKEKRHRMLTKEIL